MQGLIKASEIVIHTLTCLNQTINYSLQENEPKSIIYTMIKIVDEF